MEERYANSVDMSRVKLSSWTLVSVPDPKPTPAWITFSITQSDPTESDIRAGWGLG